MISLNSDCEVITSDVITKGTVNTVSVYSREVVKRALETRATFVIFAHNHPTGVLAPSDDDIKTTRILADALNFINVKVIDHVIVSRGEHISLFADYKVFDE
jgi:DNA repair protein RadC